MEYIAPAVASGIASQQEALAAYNAGMRNYLVAHPDGGTPQQWGEYNEAWSAYERSIQGPNDAYKPVTEQSGYRSLNPSLTERPQTTSSGYPTEQEYKDLLAESERPTANTSIPSDAAATVLGDKALLAAAGAAGAAIAIATQDQIDQQNKPFLPINNRPSATPIPGPTPTGPTTTPTPTNTIPSVVTPTIENLMDGVGGYYQSGRRRKRPKRRPK
jgi:hypothetical protein